MGKQCQTLFFGAGLGLDCRRKMGSGQTVLCPAGTPEQEQGASRILQPLFSPHVDDDNRGQD